MNYEGKRVESASVNTVRLQEPALSYWQSAAFMSAVDLDVFSAVDGGATTAAATGISETNAERLVTVLLAIGLLEADGQQEGFANAVDVDRFLVKDKSSYINEAGFIDVTVNPFVEGTLTRITGTCPSP